MRSDSPCDRVRARTRRPTTCAGTSARALGRHRPPLRARGRGAAARLGARSSTRSPSAGARRLWQLLHTRALRARARRAHRQPGRADGAGGPRGDLPVAAGRWRPTPTSPAQMYPDQSLYPADSVPAVVRRINNALQRADQIEHAEGEAQPRLVRADRGRRRGRLRRPAQRLRADEGDDRGRRRRRALRGPARLGEEVRPHGRQGARADRPASSARWSRRGWPPTCSGVPTRARGPHRRRQREAPHDRRRRARPPVHRQGRAHRRGLLPRAGRPRVRDRPRPAPTRPTPTCSGARPRRPTSTRRGSSPRAIHEQFPGKLLAYNCSPSFNWKKNLDDATIASFQRELGRDGLQVPVRHAGRLPRAQPLDVRAGARLPRRAGWPPTRELQQAEFAAEATRLHRDAAPARGGHRLLRPGGAGRLGRHRLDAGARRSPPRRRSSERAARRRT